MEPSIAAKIGCCVHTLLDWVKKAYVDSGKRAGLPKDVAEKLRDLERENLELRQARAISAAKQGHSLPRTCSTLPGAGVSATVPAETGVSPGLCGECRLALGK